MPLPTKVLPLDTNSRQASPPSSPRAAQSDVPACSRLGPSREGAEVAGRHLSSSVPHPPILHVLERKTPTTTTSGDAGRGREEGKGNLPSPGCQAPSPSILMPQTQNHTPLPFFPFETLKPAVNCILMEEHSGGTEWIPGRQVLSSLSPHLLSWGLGCSKRRTGA